MSMETARSFFLWCSVINYAILLLWAAATTWWRGGLYGLWRCWFKLSDEQFDMVNFVTMGLYKMGIFLFNLVPCIALYIVK